MSEYVRMRKSTMDSIAKAIQEKEGSTDKISGAEMPARIEAIGGGVNYLDYCVSFNIWSLNLFGTPKVEITLPKATLLDKSFYINMNATDTEGRTNKTVEELIVHCDNVVTSLSFAFGQNNYYTDRTLQKIVMDFETNAYDWIYCFRALRSLKYIEGIPINLTPIYEDRFTNGMFTNCDELIGVRFKGILSVSLTMEDCKNLSKESILNLFSCLSSEVSGKTLTLSQTAVDTAFETSEGAADGSTSAEWMALVEAHSNWTISLV